MGARSWTWPIAKHSTTRWKGHQLFVADTNLLVYAADRDAPEHERCRELLLEWRNQAAPWHLTWSIAYEFLRVTTHARVLRRPWSSQAAWEFLRAVLAAPSLSLLGETDQHGSVLRDLIERVPRLAGNLLHDAHTAALMLEHGVRVIYTRDADFHRFPGIEVRDPLASAH